MGAIINLEERFARNLERIKINVAAGGELAAVFADTATHLAKHDQAVRLRSLKSKILADVKFLLDVESSAKSGFVEGRLISAPLSFAIGGLAGMFSHHKNPLKTGLNTASSTLGKKLPFGTVSVAIGQGGLPDDVKAVPLSALARQSKTTESAVRKAIVIKGYLLMTPEGFAAMMDGIEHLVFDGALSLPVSLNEVRKRIRPVIIGRFPLVQDK